ncbi:uncharacterized protein [Diadema antillarum]|uniref:uncharacterized protein n=1 Tax=Diadema antillarum TaxID=105358 RepID=UPI003A8B11A1
MPGIQDESNGGPPGSTKDLLYDQFIQAGTFQGILKTFFQLCEELGLKPFTDHHNFYHRFKSQLNSWKAKSLWAKLDKRANRKEYKKGKACSNTNVFIIGAGPCGLRTAIECAMLGAKVVIVEKRQSFSRNNVLHLWPFLITDLRNLGAKKFFGKFCAGAIDHISIRQLQVIVLKVALIFGVEIHTGVTFEDLEQPPEDQEHEKIGWRARLSPRDHPVSEFEFDVIVGADGRRNTLHGFKRKEFRGKLAIAITANFINRHSNEEARVEEISGVAFIFNQKFFQDLRQDTGIDLENIVYYKDETHYFVMTAKKQSLLNKGVILKDLPDTARLLRADNVDHIRLQEYAREAADFSTSFQLPSMDYALNHYGQPDVAMFDFTSIYAAEHAARVLDRNGHKLLLALVGDSLLEPFWPTGSGCARGFLGAFDASWMIRNWSSGSMTPLQVLAERESSYRLLAQTTPENLSKIYESYGIPPNSRYPHINGKAVQPPEVIHLYDTLDEDLKAQFEVLEKKPTVVLSRTASVMRSSKVQMWCQRVMENYPNVKVENMTTSWRNGLALCAIIHRYRPHLVDYNSLKEDNVEANNQLAFDIAESELGIPPPMTGKEMAQRACPDKLTIVAYVLRFYDLFRDEVPPSLKKDETKDAFVPGGTPTPTKTSISKSSFLSRLTSKVRRKSHEKHADKENGEKSKASGSTLGSKRKHKHKDPVAEDIREKKKLIMQQEAEKAKAENGKLNVADKNELNVGIRGQNKVSGLAEQLQANLRSNFGMDTPDGAGLGRPKPKPLTDGGNVQQSQLCEFCGKRVYVMERLSAEGMFFHRDCFKCQDCDITLRLGNYAYLPSPDGKSRGRFLCRLHFTETKLAARKRSYLDKDEEIRPKKQVISNPSLEEAMEDENENIATPKSPTSPKGPKTPSKKRSFLSPFFGRRSKTTPEREQMQKMYADLAKTKGTLTEEEQALYNLGTSKMTDDELEESSESELEDEEWRKKGGKSMSARMVSVDEDEDEEDYDDEEEYDDEDEDEEEEEEEEEEDSEYEYEEDGDEEDEEVEDSDMIYEEESGEEYYTDDSDEEDEDDDDEEDDEDEEEEVEVARSRPSYDHLRTTTSLKMQWLNDTKAPQMTPWKPPEVIQREKEEAERKRRLEEEEMRRQEEERRRIEEEEEERRKLEEKELQEKEDRLEEEGEEEEATHLAVEGVTQDESCSDADIIRSLRKEEDGEEQWTDRRKKWRDNLATKFASYEDDTLPGRMQKAEELDAAADEQSANDGDVVHEESQSSSQPEGEQGSSSQSEEVGDEEESDEVEDYGEGDLEDETSSTTPGGKYVNTEKAVPSRHYPARAEEDDYSDIRHIDTETDAVTGTDDDDLGEDSRKGQESCELSERVGEVDTTSASNFSGEAISYSSEPKDTPQDTEELLFHSHSTDPRETQDTEQSESIAEDSAPVLDKVVSTHMHGIVEGEVVNLGYTSSEPEEIDIDELIGSPEPSKPSTPSTKHPARFDAKPNLAPLQTKIVEIYSDDAITPDDSSATSAPQQEYETISEEQSSAPLESSVTPHEYDTISDEPSSVPVEQDSVSKASSALPSYSSSVLSARSSTPHSHYLDQSTSAASELSSSEPKESRPKYPTPVIKITNKDSDSQSTRENTDSESISVEDMCGAGKLLLESSRKPMKYSGMSEPRRKISSPDTTPPVSPISPRIVADNEVLIKQRLEGDGDTGKKANEVAQQPRDDDSVFADDSAVAESEISLEFVSAEGRNRTSLNSYHSLPHKKKQRFSVGFEGDVPKGAGEDLGSSMTASPSLPEKLNEAKAPPKAKPKYESIYSRSRGVRSSMSSSFSESFSQMPSLEDIKALTSPKGQEPPPNDGANKNANNATAVVADEPSEARLRSPEDYVPPPSAINPVCITRDTLSNKVVKEHTSTAKAKVEKYKGKKGSPKKRVLKRSKDKRKSESELLDRERGKRSDRWKQYEVSGEKEAGQGDGRVGTSGSDHYQSLTPHDAESGSKRKRSSKKKGGKLAALPETPSTDLLNLPEDEMSPLSDTPFNFDGGIPRSESRSKEKKSRLSRLRMDLPRRRDAVKTTKHGRRSGTGLQEYDENHKGKSPLKRSESTRVTGSEHSTGAIPKQRRGSSLRLKKRLSAGKINVSSTDGDSADGDRAVSPSLDLPLGQFGEEAARSKRKIPDAVADLGVVTPEATATEQLPRLIKKLSVDADLTGDLDIGFSTEEEEEEEERKQVKMGLDSEAPEAVSGSPRTKGKSPRRMWGKRFKKLRSLKKLRKALGKKAARQEQERRKLEEEELSARLTKRVQREARRQHHQQQLKRHRMAQEIQRQLQEVEVKQRELENRGVKAEMALRGEETPEGVDETTLMQEWFSLVNEKNALVRFETELMVQARELELEDRHSQLEQELRQIMAVEEGRKSSSDREAEKLLLDEMLEVVEQRDALVAFLEEERLKEQQEDQDFEAIMLKKGLMTAVR